MPASSFDKRNVSSSRQPWLATLSPGVSLANLFALYPSKGDVTISSANTIPSLLDGPIQVARYGALTVNAALTLTNRCRGGVILADSLSMGASGSISMTARGAAGSSKWANQDIGIPTSMVLSGKNTSQRAFLDWIASTGYCIFDPTLFACPMPGMGDVQADWDSWPSKMAAIVSAAGCGAGGVGPAATTSNGNTGGAGTLAPGGGGTGDSNASGCSTPCGGSARVWGGGSASGGNLNATYCARTMLPDDYGGAGGAAPFYISNAVGGGAGNPGGAATGAGSAGGTGTGGVLVVIVRGNITLAAGHAITSLGSAGGNGSYGCGGGSGGGRVAIYYGGTLTGTPNLSAAGGAGGTGYTYVGAAGGAGATNISTFTSMGWA